MPKSVGSLMVDWAIAPRENGEASFRTIIVPHRSFNGPRDVETKDDVGAMPHQTDSATVLGAGALRGLLSKQRVDRLLLLVGQDPVECLECH
jgi:hypothetical protein